MTKDILIVGHGFVGKAVDYGFQTSNCNTTIADPKYGIHLVDVLNSQPGIRFDATFVCVPTPYGKDGEIDDSIVKDTVNILSLVDKTGMIVIKSTVTPDTMYELTRMSGRVIYNPEFLTEKNANEEFVNPRIHVFGGQPDMCKQLEDLYKEASQCKPCPVQIMSAMEASFVKYGINCFLATKVLWFNQFKDVVDKWGSNYHKVINAIGTDPRVGFSHTRVPGFDGRKGFGGACFPKDTAAFAAFADDEFSVLNEAIRANNKYRQAYELDEREKEQKVVYA